MRRGPALISLLFALALGVPAAASAAPGADIRGTWSCVPTAGGTCTFTIDAVDPATGAITGTGAGNGYTWAVTGTLNGLSLSMTHGPYAELPSYTAVFTAEVSADGGSMQGTYDDGGGPVPFTYPRLSGPPGSPTPAPPPGPAPPPPGTDTRRPVGAIVVCNRGPQPTDDSRCVVTLGDAGPPPGGPPLGTVSWRLTGPGSLRQRSCVLQRSAYGGTISSCEVVFAPGPAGTPAGTAIPVVADYPGSAVHRPISREHRLIDARIINPGTGEPAPTANECDSAADGLRPRAKSSIDNRYRDPTRNALDQPTGYREGFFEGSGRRFAWCVASAGTAVTGAAGTTLLGAASVLYTGALTAGFGVMGAEIGPVGTIAGGTLGLATGWQYGGSQTMSAAGDIFDATGRTLNDPPDRRYKVLAKTRKVASLRVRSGRSKTARRDASLLRGWFARLHRVRALSEALAATADKAGGARKAGNRTWEGRQMRHGITLAKRLANELDRLAPVARRVAARAAKSREAKARPSARGFDRARRRLARSGFTKAEVRRLKRLGFTADDRAAVRRAARDRKLTRRALLRPVTATVRSTAHAKLYVAAARYFRLWAAHPYVVAQSRLR